MAYERLLLSPKPAELVTALLEATREANRALPILALDFDDWEDFVADMAPRRDGRRQWSDTLQGDTACVGVTWWTDHVGRRHVRVTGASSRDGPQRLTSSRTDSRPPLWHLYPGRVFYRERRGLGEWWGVCGCGVAGRPESVGWMGTMCGPCHDRQQEGQPVEAGCFTGVLTHQGYGVPPAFSPDGTMLAVLLAPVVDQEFVRVHRLVASPALHVDLPRTRSIIGVPVFSPDGQQIAYAEDHSNTLGIRDLRSGRAVWEVQPRSPVSRYAFSPDGRFLAAGGPGGLQVWRRREGRPDDWGEIDERAGNVTALAFSPDGTRLAVAHEGQLSLLHPGTARTPHQIADAYPRPHLVRDLAFSADGQGLTCYSLPERSAHMMMGYPFILPDDGPASVQVFAMSPMGKLLARHALPDVGPGWLSPQGDFLAGAGGEGNTAYVLDVATGRELGQVGWDVEERLQHVTFAPDGRTLALVGIYGNLKLVPWSALLA